MSCITGWFQSSLTRRAPLKASRPSRRSSAITALSCLVALMSFSVAQAIGPNNQVVPNPAPGAANTFSSVVGVVQVAGGNIVSNGTGTIIDSEIIDGNGYFCILTADHNFPSANSIIFPNYTPGGAAPGAGVYSILANQRVAGFAGQTLDLNVALVRYGTPDAFYFNTPDKSLGNSVGVGNTLAEIGFGREGIPVLTGANLTGLDEGTFASGGTKRYQNNLLTSFVANAVHGIYTENDITYTFDAQGTANFIPGEGMSFRGDSGSPLFNNGTTFDPGSSLPAIASTDSIVGVDVFGPVGNIRNGAVENAVDVFDYRANIGVACAAIMPTPEPATLFLASLSVCVTVFVQRSLPKRGHVSISQ